MEASWFTLVRFKGTPTQLTGVTQARTPQEALTQLAQWQERYPEDTTVVFDRDNQPIMRQVLADRAGGAGLPALPSAPTR